MPLFETRDGHYVPTGLTIGPWDRGSQHGGAMAALFATVLEDAGGDGYRSMRLTVDLLKPAPVEPLEVRHRTVRRGRRVQLLEAEAFRSDDLIARATLLRLSAAPIELPGGVAGDPGPAPDSPDDYRRCRTWQEPSFFDTGVEVRARDPERFFGSDVGWFRLRVPVVEGTSPSPMARAAAAADFGNGISAISDGDGGLPDLSARPLNVDVDVHLLRPPDGEWIRMHSRSVYLGSGVGLTRSDLWDARGFCGVAQQTLVVF